MRFFVIDPVIASSVASMEFDKAEPAKLGPVPRCEKCGQPTGPLTWEPPYFASIRCKGAKTSHFLTGAGRNILVSRDFANRFTASGLSGLTPFEEVAIAESRGCAKTDVPEYLHAEVLAGGMIDPQASGLEYVEPGTACDLCGLNGILARVRKIAVDEASWDGKDLFVPRNLPGIYLVTERFCTFWLAHELGDAPWLSADEYWFDFYPGKAGYGNAKGSSCPTLPTGFDEEPTS